MLTLMDVTKLFELAISIENCRIYQIQQSEAGLQIEETEKQFSYWR